MCGICGIVDRTGDTDLRAAVEGMMATLEHRGPDGGGVLVEGPVGLGHRRLAIIDLSEDGAQPMVDASGRYVLTYNGEIYNYLELRAGARRPRSRISLQQRLGGLARRVRALGAGIPRAAQRDVRLRDLGSGRGGSVWCA